MAIFNWLEQQNMFVEMLLLSLAIIIIISIYLFILYFIFMKVVMSKEKKMIRFAEKAITSSAQQIQSAPSSSSDQPHPLLTKIGSNIKSTPESHINVGDNKIKSDIISNKPFDGVEASVHDN